MSKRKSIIKKIDPERIRVIITYENIDESGNEEFSESDLERINRAFEKTSNDDYIIRIIQSYFEIFLRTDEL